MDDVNDKKVIDDFMEDMGHRSHSGTPPTDAPVANPQISKNKKRKADQQAEAVKKPKVMENKAIWVSNLPPDTTKEELSKEFSRFGIIDKGADGEPRINMYFDKETDEFNGTAMVKYFRKESIVNAIKMMDEYYLRPGETSHGTIRVQEADLNYKKEKDGDAVASKLTRDDRKAADRNRAELARKLAEWSDNEEEVAQTFAPKKNKWAKVVIMKPAFDLKELEADPAAYLDIKEDVRDVAEEFGHVTNCTLYDEEADGIVTIRFREFEAAEEFVKKNQGRMFARRKLVLALADSKPRFKKSGREEEPASEEE